MADIDKQKQRLIELLCYLEATLVCTKEDDAAADTEDLEAEINATRAVLGETVASIEYTPPASCLIGTACEEAVWMWKERGVPVWFDFNGVILTADGKKTADQLINEYIAAMTKDEKPTYTRQQTPRTRKEVTYLSCCLKDTRNWLDLCEKSHEFDNVGLNRLWHAVMYLSRAVEGLAGK